MRSILAHDECQKISVISIYKLSFLCRSVFLNLKTCRGIPFGDLTQKIQNLVDRKSVV